MVLAATFVRIGTGLGIFSIRVICLLGTTGSGRVSAEDFGIVLAGSEWQRAGLRWSGLSQPFGKFSR